MHGTLVGCDYCPATFHTDCLDPPLAVAPRVTWMCPLHVEHCIDRRLLRSTTNITRRQQYWNKYGGSFEISLRFIRNKYEFRHAR